MGVRGWSRLLKNEGWIPNYELEESLEPHSLCRAAIGTSSNPTSRRIRNIPANAELHIDGYGLAFFLYRVAFSREIRQTFMGHEKCSEQFDPLVMLQKASENPSQIRALLPCFCPLLQLHSVTNEFLNALVGTQRNIRAEFQNRKIIVYWDGDFGYSFKDETKISRRSSMDDEWDNLYHYCKSGRIPSVTSVESWERKFPKSRLFLTQVQHTIKHFMPSRVTVVACEGEADHIIAQAASQNPNAFVIGNDSDFCFFRGINYIPIETLGISTNGVATAVVIQRVALAQDLQLPDEFSMVELGLLMGNDYINSSDADFNDIESIKVDNTNHITDYPKIIEFLKNMGPGYRVKSNSKETEEVLRFVRSLYDYKGLDDFAHAKDGTSEAESSPIANSAIVNLSGFRGTIPCTFDFSLAEIQPHRDITVRDATLRCLLMYMRTCDSDGTELMISQQHIDAFRQMDFPSTIAASNEFMEHNPCWRPTWDDVRAASLIEKTITFSYKTSPDSLVIRMNPPYLMFDQQRFHAVVQFLRKSSVKVTDKFIAQPNLVESDKTIDFSISNITNTSATRVSLPVDEFEDEILNSLRKHRVTIIQGETGCGKSSRIPLMLLKAPPPEDFFPEVKLFLAQPRRIAAKALIEHIRTVEPTYRNKVALRMGHGVREYENNDTRAWFVTTGYLVRLLANHPERFDNISYIIVDEVHERSVETDILCLLCKRLLQSNPRTRLVFMSATLAAAMYQNYFEVLEPPIKVGARRFPVEEIYLEDLYKKVEFPQSYELKIKSIVKENQKIKCLKAPSLKYMEMVYSVVSFLATTVGVPGSAVLIFVPGMNDIVQITDLIKRQLVSGRKFVCFPVHSDIPFEEQMQVFAAPVKDEVKIIIATNAAESSITLPDVDHVICLGLCKQIMYNKSSHRQMLAAAWISKASAEQRKGRTGRLRPGTVYRIYTKVAYDNYMDAFEPGEILRMPLDSVILQLKVMLRGENVKNTLLDCLEPPDISTIDRSLLSLCNSYFITSPDENSDITTLGSFVSCLGIDLTIGSLIGLGIQFGVGPEAIQLGAILSTTQSPWIMSNPLIHKSSEYNDNTVLTYMSKCYFDAHLYSEPFAVMNLLWEYDKTSKKSKWCRKNGVFPPRMKRLESTYRNLRSRISEFIGIDNETLKIEIPPMLMSHSKVSILRIIQVWVFHNTIIEFNPKDVIQECVSDSRVMIKVEAHQKVIETRHLDQILKPSQHDYNLLRFSHFRQKGKFTSSPNMGLLASSTSSLSKFEQRLISYASDYGFDIVSITVAGKFLFFSTIPGLLNRLQDILPTGNVLGFKAVKNDDPTKKLRGRCERACGRWFIKDNLNDPDAHVHIIWERLESSNITKKDLSRLNSKLAQLCKSHLTETMTIELIVDNVLDLVNGSFVIELWSSKVDKVAEIDLVDLFASADANAVKKKYSNEQLIVFNVSHHKASCQPEQNPIVTASVDRPLLQAIPEGARLLSVLASGRRNEHVLRLLSPQDETSGDMNANNEILIHLNSTTTNISKRWKRFRSKQTVFVQPNSVPASTVPMNYNGVLYCVCANTLDLAGGGLKAEGLTLLPSGSIFLFLCKLTFGILQSNDIEPFLMDRTKDIGHTVENDDSNLKRRLKDATLFNESSKTLGTSLQCFPDKVKDLISIFNGIDDYEWKVWDNLENNPFYFEKLSRSLSNIIEQDNTNDNSGLNEEVTHKHMNTEDEKLLEYERTVKHRLNFPPKNLERMTLEYDEASYLSKLLFTHTHSPGYEISDKEFPSSNIFSLIVNEVKDKIHHLSSEDMTLHGPTWSIYRYELLGEDWYHARYTNSGVPNIKKKLSAFPRWYRSHNSVKLRPCKISEAILCVPRSLTDTITKQTREAKIVNEDVLLFKSIEMAVKMEAAFWLERQFCTRKRHWFQVHDIKVMVNQLHHACQSVKSQNHRIN